MMHAGATPAVPMAENATHPTPSIVARLLRGRATIDPSGRKAAEVAAVVRQEAPADDPLGPVLHDLTGF